MFCKLALFSWYLTYTLKTTTISKVKTEVEEMAVLSVTTLCRVVSTEASVLSLSPFAFVQRKQSEMEILLNPPNLRNCLSDACVKMMGMGRKGKDKKRKYTLCSWCFVKSYNTCLFSQCHKSSFCLHQKEHIYSHKVFKEKSSIRSYVTVCILVYHFWN